MTDTRSRKWLMLLRVRFPQQEMRVNAWSALHAATIRFLQAISPTWLHARPGGKMTIAALAPTTRVYTNLQNWWDWKSWGAETLRFT